MKDFVFVTEEQYNTLITTGSIVVEGVTYYYDDENIYAVKEIVDTTPIENSNNLITSGAVYSAIQEAINNVIERINSK